MPRPLTSGGLPKLKEHANHERGGLANAFPGGGIGSKAELEQALSQAQTALMMAKERIAHLEQQNAMLRGKVAEGRAATGSPNPGASGVTKEKLAEAQQLLKAGMINDEDFAAIKAKFMQDSFGVGPQ